MSLATSDFRSLQFSAASLPARDRLPFWRDFVIRNVLLAEVAHLTDLPLEVDVKILALPGLRMGWFNVPTPMRCSRTRKLLANEEDCLSFFIKKSGQWTLSQRQREVSLGEGDAVGVLDGKPSTKIVSQLNSIRLFVPRTVLTPLVGDIENVAMRVVPHNNEALRLLKTYLSGLSDQPALATPELRQMVSTHVVDLIAMALGATRDGAALANGRGVRAARLRAIKSDILQNLGSLELSVTAVAHRQRVTPRYVHMTFELEGMTFSEFVLSQRLMRAYRMLLHPRHAGLTISSIAFAVGFGDLSYFNRTFRRRFGMTPSDLRQAAPQERPGNGIGVDPDDLSD